MAISHATIAAVIAVWGGRFNQNPASGHGAVFMGELGCPDRGKTQSDSKVYWYIANFAVTWGPLAWVVSAEVFPLDMRAKGMSISSAINWLSEYSKKSTKQSATTLTHLQ